MTLGMCMECHAKDEVPLSDKMPTGHVHMLSGISCQRCHGGRMPFTKVDMKTCTTCHSTQELAKAEPKDHFHPNPHNSHYGTEVECSLCHHQHKRSEFMCTQCHDFRNVTPSPIVALSFPAGSKAAAPAAKAAVPKVSGPPLSCRTCHYEPPYTTFLAPSPHGGLRCEACHKGIGDFSRHASGSEAAQTLSCLSCHQDMQKQGFHASLKQFSCMQCHGGIHPQEAPAAGRPSAKAAVKTLAPAPADCTSCHAGPRFREHFAQTSHGALGCNVCHQGVRDLAAHMQKKEKTVLMSCTVCHKDVEKTYRSSVHAMRAGLSCLDCHRDIHPDRAVDAVKGKAAVIETCTICHNDRDRYVKKGHDARVLAGNRDAASCADCHGVHDTPVFASAAAGSSMKKAYYTDRCVSCHREGGVALRYGVFPMAVKTYGETYHGKVRQLGHIDKVAGCADCHMGHNILPPDDPASALTTNALVKTCGKCHTGFHPRFVTYVPHPNPDDHKAFPGLYLTKVFMIALVVGVFAFFWVHVALWWRKAYAEKSCLVRGGAEALSGRAGEAVEYVRRFSLRDRIMHVVLICSFFGLVLSGFPLKYPAAMWARPLIGLFGGVENAGVVHRVSAAVMWGLFLYTCWLSLKFLFPGFRFRGWLERLFGPDSLFPRIKDFQDCWGMFRWFFNAGEKPRFDRWTYWEKFDFMAVFWGMFVIGLSGIVMWIPELSSYVMPGWMINIVHLAHSEEAFLAAVFIFTIHFFNNHLVPDKFPLERNIFTGSYTIEDLRIERPLEYERVLGENRLEEIRCAPPGTGIQLFAGIFGLASVILGLALTVLIFWAVFSG
jgi:cytochrome b subunit of formate dehydrogenase